MSTRLYAFPGTDAVQALIDRCENTGDGVAVEESTIRLTDDRGNDYEVPSYCFVVADWMVEQFAAQKGKDVDYILSIFGGREVTV